MEAKKVKMVSVWAALVLLVLMSVGQAATITYMDGTLHNGSLTAVSAGQWYDTPDAIPAGWYESLSYGCYQAAGGTYTIIASAYGSAINNTGELVQTGRAFTVSADLGGSTDGLTTYVRVYATQNSDGTGTTALLAEVSRLNGSGQGYTLYPTTGTPGSATPPTLDGYYVQVVLVGGGAYFDNIVVTSEEGPVTSVTYMDGVLHNGSLTATEAGYWNQTPGAIPDEWFATSTDPIAVYQAGLGAWTMVVWQQAICNTGEAVLASHAFTVSADLGGTSGSIATVRVYATENADGTGDKRVLAEVRRVNGDGQGYTIYATTSTGLPTQANVAGYYVQVELDGPGYYDNIVVTSELSEEPNTTTTYMDAGLHNGSLLFASTGFWYNTPAARAAGWVETALYAYSSGAAQGAVQLGSTAVLVNNTGEVVPASQAFTVSADLGGYPGSNAKVQVYATENADGSGTKLLLAEVSRLAVEPANYNMHPVSATGSTAQPSVTGYYVQVVLATYGYYDNITVTSDLSTGPVTIKYMDESLHNGGMTAASPGFWNVPASKPSGWDSTDDPNVYTTTQPRFAIFGSRVEAVFNNTGETVPTNHQFTIQAELGGKTNTTAGAYVYATQNADGSGDKHLLVQVNRPGNDADGYSQFHVSATGSPTDASLDGYYVQVLLKTAGMLNVSGYYDNITVTSIEASPTKTYMDQTLHNGAMTATSSGGYWTNPAYVPSGWSAGDPNRVYTTAVMFTLFDSPAGAVTNNTQESVMTGHEFTVQADLGGVTGATAHVYVYATENWDGTGDTVLLVDLSRPGNDADGYDLSTVSATGSIIGAEYSGYYVQVVLVTTGATDLNAFYDNIIVTSSVPIAPGCREQFDAATQAYYDRYVTEPVAWCWQFQCKGDADNGTESVFIEGDYRIYDADLTLLVNNWKGTPEGGANPAADFDHMEEAVFIEGSYAIYDGDLTILVNNWKKTDGELSNCPSYLP